MSEGREETKASTRRRRFGFAVLVAAAAILIAACVPPPPPPPQGTISGTLSNGSIPLTQHGLVATDASGNTVGSANTDGSGNYSMQVPTGNYRINFLGGGPCQGEWFDNKPDLATANVVNVADGASVTASAVLNCPTISGHVTNSSGAPLPGVGVQAFASPFSPSLPAATDANGFYRVFVGPGSYKVRFTQSNGCTEWFSDEPSMNSADLVSVPSGGGATADAVVQCGTIAGTVTDGTNPVPDLSVGAYDTAGNLITGAVTNSSGIYSFPIAPGNYKIEFSGACGEWFSDKPDHANATIVGVSAGTTATANAALECGTISGTISDGTNPIPFTRVELKDEVGEWVTSAQTGSAGEFSFLLPPGTYKLYFNTSNNIDEWFDDHEDSTEADLITLAAGEHFIADAVVGAGQIQGTVTDGANPIAEVLVNVYDAAGNLVTSTTTDNAGFYGTFSIGARGYFVEFSHSSFVTEWWNNKADLASANQVIVTVDGTTTVNAVLAT